MPGYELTAEADSDLEDIARYTIREWGTKQAAQYAGKLERCFEKIARKEAVFRSFSEKLPEASVTRCEHHYIFYLHPEGKRPVIFAVLHERMDLLARLKDRLG
ncbi:MAG: type II toxin-antitoxin system RelE/ParE family toxin [Nitrospinales bacterium]